MHLVHRHRKRAEPLDRGCHDDHLDVLTHGLGAEVEEGRLEHRRVGKPGEHHGELGGVGAHVRHCSDELLRGAGRGGRCLDDASRLEAVGPGRRRAPVAADRGHDALELSA